MFRMREPGVDQTPLKYTAILGEEAVVDAEELRDVVAAIVGEKYYDCEDGLDDWNLRLKAARNLSMQMLQYDKEVIVVSAGKHIKDNYGTDLTDADYAMDHEADFSIDIASDDTFIKSLVEHGFMKLVEN